MTLNLKVVGTNFTYRTGGNLGFSTHGKVSKYIRWKEDANLPTVYIDEHLNAQLINPNVDNYGWLLESEAIRPQIYTSVKKDPQKYLNKFKYIFTFDEELLNYDKRFKFCFAGGPWIKDANKKIYEKTKLISCIASHKNKTKGHQVRLKISNELKNDLDLYGKIPGGIPLSEKELGLNDYMFSVAIENDLTNSYFTEKILDCFVTGTIPIYLGCKSIGKFFDERGIIRLDDSFDIKNITKELYYEKLEYVKNNFEICKEKEFTIMEDYIFLNYFKS